MYIRASKPPLLSGLSSYKILEKKLAENPHFHPPHQALVPHCIIIYMNPLIMNLKWSNPDLRTKTDHGMNDWLSKSIRQISQLFKVLASSLCPLLERQFLPPNPLRICHLVPLGSGLAEVPELLETSETPATPGWKRISTPYSDENTGGYSEKVRHLIPFLLPTSQILGSYFP